MEIRIFFSVFVAVVLSGCVSLSDYEKTSLAEAKLLSEEKNPDFDLKTFEDLGLNENFINELSVCHFIHVHPIKKLFDTDYFFSFSAWVVEGNDCSGKRITVDEITIWDMRNGGVHLGENKRNKWCRNTTTCSSGKEEAENHGACFNVYVKHKGVVLANRHNVC